LFQVRYEPPRHVFDRTGSDLVQDSAATDDVSNTASQGAEGRKVYLNEIASI
jgi:hypothetical protein